MSQTKAQLVSGTTAQDLTVDNINTTSINSGQTSGRKNLIINGAMQIAQRGTSSTSVGYVTADRFNTDYGGENEAPTYEQADVASGTTPYTQGFRKTFKVTNGNQTGGAGAGDYIFVRQKIEAQDLAGSGWNYTSASSFITLSFWVKSSVAQNFNCRLETQDGTVQNFPFQTGSLSADTWTKVTKTIPGNSNITIDNNNGTGLEIHWQLFRGTNFTDNSVSNDTWAAYASGTRTKDATSTWWTTNDATWEITGVQLEVGSTASDFEHKTFIEDLRLCQRYYYKSTQYSYKITNPIDTSQQVDGDGYLGWVFYNSTSCRSFNYEHPVEMRASPTVTFYSSNRVSSPDNGKMAVYSGAWYNLTTNTAETNTRRLGIKGGYTPGLTTGNVYLIGGGFECNSEL